MAEKRPLIRGGEVRSLGIQPPAKQRYRAGLKSFRMSGESMQEAKRVLRSMKLTKQTRLERSKKVQRQIIGAFKKDVGKNDKLTEFQNRNMALKLSLEK